jgi:hypothetical protein
VSLKISEDEYNKTISEYGPGETKSKIKKANKPVEYSLLNTVYT